MPTEASVGERAIDEWLSAHGEGLIAFRRNMHAHPELSGVEYATTELVAERLELAGLKPRRLSSGTGLVCDVAPTKDGQPFLALRADLDALAMDDKKTVQYRSQVPGVTHACGHDAHTAVMLGTALYFAHHPNHLPGPLRFLFQPAEERVPGGALDVINDAGLAGTEAILGLHCDPKLDVGRVGIKAGAITSAADLATITLSGPGGHTARPELTVDLTRIASRVVCELPGLVAANLDSPEAVKVVFGAIHAGDAANVIPTRAELRVSARTPSISVWEVLPEVFDKSLTEMLADTGAAHQLDYIHGVPPVVNDPDLTATVRNAIAGELGEEAVSEAVQSWGGDDFAWYTREVKGCFLRLGVHDPANSSARLDLHAGVFDIDERAIAVGVRIMAAAATAHFATTQS